MRHGMDGAWYMRALRGRRWLGWAAVAASLLLASALLYAWEPWARPSGLMWPQGLRAGVAPRAGLADYGWDELAAIAQEIAASESQGEAYRCAERYGLCAGDGTLGGETKELVLADGSTVQVVLADVWADERTDGGKAGLSFVFATAASPRAMNHAFEDVEGMHADARGGWAASDMRAWLADTFMYKLPVDLRNHIVTVQKLTASGVGTLDELPSAGQLAGTASDWVQETSDQLWLPSVAELCGEVPALDWMGVDPSMTGVYAAEGRQYRLFADARVEAFATNEALVRTLNGQATTWWLRTKTLEFDEGFWLVGTDGTPLNGLGEDVRVVEDPEFAPEESWGPDHARGVVVGFCL